MQPEKLEDWKKSSIHPLLLQLQFHDVRQKKVRYDVRKIGNFCCCKKTKKTDLLVAKLRKFTKYEGHGSSKFDRNRCRDRQTVFGNQNSI